MVVAVCRLSLQIPEAGSLKAKRHVLRKIIDRVRARFNAAIAEVGDNDLWQRATIGFAVVSNDRAHANSMADTVSRFIDEQALGLAIPLGRDLEIVSFGDEASPGLPPGLERETR